MPLYEYRCLKCGKEFEFLQKFSDAPKRKCEECGGKLEKMVSRTSFHLKGGGWFDQGYSGGAKPDKDGSSSSDKPESDKPEKDKSEKDKSEKEKKKTSSSSPKPSSSKKD